MVSDHKTLILLLNISLHSSSPTSFTTYENLCFQNFNSKEQEERKDHSLHYKDSHFQFCILYCVELREKTWVIEWQFLNFVEYHPLTKLIDSIQKNSSFKCLGFSTLSKVSFVFLFVFLTPKRPIACNYQYGF